LKIYEVFLEDYHQTPVGLISPGVFFSEFSAKALSVQAYLS